MLETEIRDVSLAVTRKEEKDNNETGMRRLSFPYWSFAIAAMLEELDKRIFNEFFVMSSNMADMFFVILLSWRWLQTKN